MFQYDENLFKEVWKNINDSLNIINSKERVLNELQNCDNLECESDILKLVSSSKQIQKNLEDLNDKIKNTLNIANNNSFVSPLTENNEFNISFELLKELMEIANADSQINLSGIFANFTDYQNIMLSNLSFFELFFRDNENMLKGKTIEDLFLETYDVNNNYTINDYISFSLDTDKIISLNDVDNRNKYLNLFLGKMVLNGFANIKINELVNGEDSFDAIIFTDQNDDTLVYFSCTDLYEFDDYLYDAYPILNTFSNLGKSIGEVANAEKIYKSQQRQALELVKKYLSNDNSKVNTSVEVKNKQENLNNGNMDLKMELELLADTYKPVNLELIDSLEMEEYEDKSKYGMSIYFVKKGDTLWKIAKRFRTTVDEIVSANNIEDPNKINVGEQLFIPKYNSDKREKLA